MRTPKELDKFYTHPDIAKIFVRKINEIVDLSGYDMVLEPSAGSGNILQFLPDHAIGLDLEPEHDMVIKQDFFEYVSPYDPLYNNIRIATVGNPPFGTGYMNPLAKRFFNHAATFSDMIAFIVPQKWHTSWKVHRGLDKNFGLYYSEPLPKNSFVFNGRPYDVKCCMQVWSKSDLGENLRMISAPPTKHEDFEMFLTCDKVPGAKLVRQQIAANQYWDFGLKYWGKIALCDIESIPENTTTHFVFRAKAPHVRHVFENIDWHSYVSNMGAPNVGGKSVLIKAYIETKKKMGI